MHIKIKAQSAIEYIVTYGWAILIIALVLAALYSLGIFNPTTYVVNRCTLPSDFNCGGAFLRADGNFTFTIGQSTSAAINITAISCNDTVSTVGMMTYNSLFLLANSNVTTHVQCYSGNVPFSGDIGALYNGYLIFNYTDLGTGFQHTIVGTIAEKVVGAAVIDLQP